MNNKNPKLQIYQGIIEYLLESTNYNLKNIAELSNSSIEQIRSIYTKNIVPAPFKSELGLLKLYQIILEFHTSRDNYFVERAVIHQ
jgi:hypothetical protein